MQDRPLTIIIPTFNNRQQLSECISSLFYRTPKDLLKVVVINNGHKESCDFLKDYKEIIVHDSKENLGWTGGIKKGMEFVDTPYVMFSNDDVFIPVSTQLPLQRMLNHFRDSSVGAVGPATNVCMGLQNIWADCPSHTFEVSMLIFFNVMLRTEAIVKAGGIDDKMYGGDDFDMCIRLKDVGYRLVVDKNIFVYHHGMQTGNRVYGDQNITGGWNSYEYTHKVDTELIRKHGFRKYAEFRLSMFTPTTQELQVSTEDSEGNVIRQIINDSDSVCELGCGGNKTVDTAVGVDIIAKGQLIESIGVVSQADIVCDVTGKLPFKTGEFEYVIARHILEHVIDPVAVLKEWFRIVKKGGSLIIAVPNQNFVDSIPMNIEHLHAYIPESLGNLAQQVLGVSKAYHYESNNNISFILRIEK